MRLEELKELFDRCDDVQFYRQPFPESQDATLVYCRSLSDQQLINELVLPELQNAYAVTRFSEIGAVRAAIGALTEPAEDLDSVGRAVFRGCVIVYFEHLNAALGMSIERIPNRQTEESNMDVSIRGPKDGLVEDLHINVGLIRKRLPTPALGMEEFAVGRNSRTRVGLLYLKGKIQLATLNEIRSRLAEVGPKLEELTSAAQLEESISDHPYSLFPLTVYTGRGDFIAACLNKGRFAILIDGVPGAMIAPSTLFLLLKTPEDTHFSFITANFGQVLRLFSLLLSAFLPSFFIALIGYHQDQIPFPLLSTIVLTRLGIPLSGPMEMFLILFFLELFKEAGYRLPSLIGQTLTVVGGLIIGDAAVRSGLISPGLVVVGAISIVAGSTLISQTLTGTVGVLRYFSLLFASFLGMYGFMLSVLFLVVYLSGLTSFGVPFLAPVTTLTAKDVWHAFWTVPRKLGGFVPIYLRRNNKG
ncbi:spore germination protein [Cohnella zeiphila]|uniref:Spore germination protein n=1 Tax=Cohnella zeiphila TaxID=2761120 RepID=A0A7X0SPB1_9BACL|nr:spore germination protein [Cohnella zeiphila]MBB6733682.1 spore germination protein [Cohnella zeiphila]